MMLTRYPDRRAARGFTLMELMIVVAIVAILAAIALPSYTSYLRRSARAEAQSFLTDLAARQQQYLVDRRAYAATLSDLNLAPPSSWSARFEDPKVEASDGPPPTFKVTAQAKGDQLKDACPTMTLDNMGNRTPATGCW